MRSAIVKDPMLYANFIGLCFIEPELLPMFYIAGIVIFDLFGSCDLKFNPMNVIYELDPYFLEIYRICKY